MLSLPGSTTKTIPDQTAATILAAVENVEAQASADMITEKVVPEKPSDPDHPIQHYLLLPLYEWGDRRLAPGCHSPLCEETPTDNWFFSK